MPAKASVKGTEIASADSFEFVEGNVYFPFDSIKDSEHTLTKSDLHTTCPWKGESQYWDVHVDGHTFKNAAWSYPEPKEKAKHIKDHVAFDKRHVSTEK